MNLPEVSTIELTSFGLLLLQNVEHIEFVKDLINQLCLTFRYKYLFLNGPIIGVLVLH